MDRKQMKREKGTRFEKSASGKTRTSDLVVTINRLHEIIGSAINF